MDLKVKIELSQEDREFFKKLLGSGAVAEQSEDPKPQTKSKAKAKAKVEEIEEDFEDQVDELEGAEEFDEVEEAEEIEEPQKLTPKELGQLKAALNSFAAKNNRAKAIGILTKFAKTSQDVKPSDLPKLLKALKV